MAYCLICYKKCDNPAQISNEAKIKAKSDIKRFFKLLERYINGGKDEVCSSIKFPNEVDKVMEAGILPCRNCYNLLENFCDIYNVLEETEMILNWKLKCLAGIMERGRDNNLLEGLKMVKDLENGEDEFAKVVIKCFEWRRMIAAKCNKKIQRSFPKLILKRNFDGATCPGMLQKYSGLNSSDNNDGYINTDNLVDSIGTRASPTFNLENTRDKENGQSGTTSKKAVQTTLHPNKLTQSANTNLNGIVDVSQETTLANLRTEFVFTSDKEGCIEYDPAEPSSESNSNSENDLENIKEESNFALPTSKCITEKYQITPDDTSPAPDLSPALENHLTFSNVSIPNSTPETIDDETPQIVEVSNKNISTINKVEAESGNEEINLANLSPVINTEEREVPPYKSRLLRSNQSCQKCSKTFSTAQKLQAHLTSHSSDEEEIPPSNAITNDEDDYDEYNPDESSSSSSESENDFENSSEEAISPSKDEIFQTKRPASERFKDLKPNGDDLLNIKRETEDGLPPTKAKVDKVVQDLRRKYKAHSDIVEFLTFPCQIEGCSEITFSLRDFKDHQTHHGTFTCDLCPNSFDYAPNLARHELSEHCNGTKKCPREGCAFEGTASYLYIHHVLTHHLKLKNSSHIRKFNCKICKTGFEGIEKLRRHLCRNAKPSTKPRVKCDVKGCTESFAGTKSMRRHISIVHLTGAKLVCQICKMVFANKMYLSRHVRKWHNKELAIKCVVETCKETFISELSLDSHVILKHKNEKDKISKLCPHCGKKIVGSGQFQTHLDSHARPKGYICETCGKVFKQKEPLNVHKLYHSGPDSWEYQCEICAKKCISKSKLEEHKRTHGNEKPFVCDVCGAKYAHRHNLRIHVNSKHGHLTKDVAKVYNRINFTSRKGVKRKRIKEEDEEDTQSSSDSDSSS